MPFVPRCCSSTVPPDRVAMETGMQMVYDPMFALAGNQMSNTADIKTTHGSCMAGPLSRSQAPKAPNLSQTSSASCSPREVRGDTLLSWHVP
ncbi:uncharacterized [Tachysurus ichikawai]